MRKQPLRRVVGENMAGCALEVSRSFSVPLRSIKGGKHFSAGVLENEPVRPKVIGGVMEWLGGAM